MSRVVLAAEGLGKAFTSYRTNLLRFAGWFGAPTRPDKEYWAVRDVSFDLKAGEALALIGQNGAGKSTLLKLITGTLRATEGSIAVNGRISAILELGLGFNPEFTGRQNVFQAGGLMGFSQQEIAAFLPELEDFAELGEFFDQPLRVYSSGMHARLAFSLATAMRPEILIVDEVLSVGDSYFQHKSFDRIRQFKKAGTAIVFVSHSMGDVRTLCDRVLLLDQGQVLKDGAADEIADYYNAMIAEKENAKLTIEQKRDKNGWTYTRSGTFELVMRDAKVVDAATGELVRTALTGQELVFKAIIEAKSAVPQLVVGVMIRDRTGQAIWGSNTWHTDQLIRGVEQDDEIEFEMRFRCDLGPGSYSITTALTDADTHLQKNFEWIDNPIIVDVINNDRPFFIGVAALQAEFVINAPLKQIEQERVAMTTSCRDTDAIPKCSDAGILTRFKHNNVQIMHNGLKVVSGGYYGNWMSKIISDLRGHHEPQEELIFYHLLKYVRSNSLMIELGAFWAYYSLWYLSAIKDSTAICIEPDPGNVAVGRKNAEINGLAERIRFVEAWLGDEDLPSVAHHCESTGQPRSLPQLSMSGISDLAEGRVIEVLHCDTQGIEYGLIKSMKEAITAKRIRFLMLSTHHHSISRSRDTHRDCLSLLKDFGATVHAEHNIDESFSGDGLILASFFPEDRTLTFPPISKNVAERSLFKGR